MLAKTNQYIGDAVTTVRQLTQEEKIRQQCEAREDYYRRTAGRDKLLTDTILERDKLSAEVEDLKNQIFQRDADIAKRDVEIELLRSQLDNNKN